MFRRASILFLAIISVTWAFSGCASKSSEPTGSEAGMDVEGDGADNGDMSSSDMAADGMDAVGDLPTVHFDFNQYTLKPSDREKLKTAAEILKGKSDLQLTIEGHCDERGSNEYNLALGERRAQAVKGYLVKLGVSGSALSTISYGEERPASLGSGESAWSENRRAEMVANQ